jgi:hypothetical protein
VYGLEHEVLVVHSTGQGLAILQPRHHGVCEHCVASKGRSLCEHCSCKMCVFLRMCDERNSPRIDRAKFQQLLAKLATFRLGTSVQESLTDPL